MKKVLALILALAMVFALVACGNGSDDKTDDQGSNNQGDTTTPPADDGGDDTTPPADDGGDDSTGPAGQTVADGMGFYDPDYDYSQNPTYKVVGMFAAVSAMYQSHIDMYAIWAKLSNCEYTTYDSNNDTDAFMTAIETYAAQEVDGIINQCDATVMDRATELFDDLGLTYMSGFSPNTDSDGLVQHPYIGVDNYGWGGQLLDWLLDYAKTNWSDWSPENTKIVFVDYSVSPLLHLRGIGTYDRWIELYPDNHSSFLVLDAVSEGSGMVEEAGYNLMAAAYARFPDVKYWLVSTCVEAFAVGAASASSSMGKDDVTCIVNAGGDSLIKQWDSGVQSAYRGALLLPPSVYSEPFWFGLYAFMSGQATPESIWPEYQSEEMNGYAYLPVYSPCMGFDEYQNYYAWSDAHYGWTGTDMAQWPNYKYDGTTEYPFVQEAGEAPVMAVENDPLTSSDLH